MKKLLLLILLFVPSYVLAADYRVVSVADGDTITVEPINGGDRIKVRLYGIDCPEMNQPFGQAGKTFVSRLVLYKTVDLDIKGQGYLQQDGCNCYP